jgi:hypothetical protein
MDILKQKDRKIEELGGDTRNSIQKNEESPGELHRLSPILFRWQAPEYEDLERGTKWYVTAVILILITIGWAVYSRSPVMAIMFLVIGIAGYINLRKKPEIMDFLITEEGVIAGKDIYPFKNLNSFWIFYETEGLKAISIHTKASFSPFVQIPLADEDPVKIREVLLKHLEEKEHELNFIETIGRILKL